jgi:hypothetical protein
MGLLCSKGLCVLYVIGLQHGVRVPAGVFEDILGVREHILHQSKRNTGTPWTLNQL